jgi:hypothetical protein
VPIISEFGSASKTPNGTKHKKKTKNLQSKLKYQRKPLQYLRVLTFT